MGTFPQAYPCRRSLNKPLTLSQSTCQGCDSPFTNLKKKLREMAQVTPNSQIQKKFNGLQFRNHHAMLLRAGRVVSLNGYIFVNSARFSTVSKRAGCVTLRQRYYKIVFAIKNT